MKESSRFYSSLRLLILLNIIIKPIWIFAIDRQVQNIVGTEVYGNYFALLNFSIVFSFLLDWGLTNFFNRQLASDPDQFSTKTSALFLIKCWFSLLYTAIVLIAAYVSGIQNCTILFYIIAIQVLTSLFVFLRSIITAQQWFSTDAWFSIIDKTMMILVCGSFIYFPSSGDITIQQFLLLQIACTGIAVLLALFLLLKRGVVLFSAPNSFINRPLLRSALPFAIIVLLMSVHYRLDAFLLERISSAGTYQAGIYAGAYRLLDAANMPGYLLASFLLPFIARHWTAGKNTEEVILNCRHLLMLFAIPVVTTVYFLGPWLQERLYHSTDPVAISVLQWCLPVLVFYSLTQVYGTVMTASGKIVPFCYICLLAVLLNIVLNLFLIPSYGAKGCCIAALISQGFAGLASLLFVHRKTGINIGSRSWLMYIFIAAVVAGFYYGCSNLSVSPWILIILAGIITIVLAVVLQLFGSKSWRQLLQEKRMK